MDTDKKKANFVMEEETCSNPSCFFCIMKEPDSLLRKAGIIKCFKEMPARDDQEHVLVLSGLWNIAMTQPNDPEFPSLGIFECMSSFIYKGINDKDWLLKDQNIYIPYYAAHVIGSYTMNKIEFAEKAVDSGVIPPLMKLLRGKISWVEQRVAIRALGHLASYEKTFDAVAEYETEVVELAMSIASTCLNVVYIEFFGEKKNRLKYQCDLLTRGVGGIEMENRKAEEWASQLQCWSIYLLNCFASKGLSLNLICKQDFLKDLCEMWGGLVNQSSPSGIGLIRILCYSKTGRRSISESKHVLETLCNLSRSSDDWQYMGIDCLLLLLKDPDTRFKVMEICTLFLVDLVETRKLGGRTNVGETLTKALLMNYKPNKSIPFYRNSVEIALNCIWDLKVQRRNREKKISEEEVEDRRVLINLLKQEGNEKFWSGEIEKAVLKYTEGLSLCPLKLRKERLVLYSNRAQCYLLLKDAEAAISDSTKALCLSNPVNSHNKSLWRRSQAYDMKGLAKESLMDCLMFVNGCVTSKKKKKKMKQDKVPYYAARMISKQVNATWLFAKAEIKYSNEEKEQVHETDGGDDKDINNIDDDDDDDDGRDMIMPQKKIANMSVLYIIEIISLNFEAVWLVPSVFLSLMNRSIYLWSNCDILLTKYFVTGSQSPLMVHHKQQQSCLDNITMPRKLLLLFLLLWLLFALAAAIKQLPGCQAKCGNIDIPHPFGIGTACSYDPLFSVTCNTAFNPPKAFIGDLEVVHLSQQEVRIKNVIGRNCYDQSGALMTTTPSYII
ncbi:ARM-repeat/Tetratricopeptide repeat (TPR)-like protein [Thalictrum thalictroides]|uniref:ARM-repeat/Tetratricopeptide repeat (TPR)-like protein n=1 Tax=Thalictrum thalictroides TaxID=46969 RepID=A0A7J6X508_THATH|nr:ARM-repeat/Tetratricopeptide repeat (TPR)-like protein [Thalictrum thalictroides]